MLRHDPIRDGYVAQYAQNLEQLKNSELPRNRFIASELGYCKRRIWYRHMGYLPAVFSARGSDYARDGNAHHDLVRTFMADMGGAKLRHVTRDEMNQLSIETFKEDVAVKHKGLTFKIHARVDGAVKLGRSWAVLEIKSIGNRDYWKYNNIWTETLDPDAVLAQVREDHPGYIYQCLAGMRATGYKQAAIVLKGRDCAAMGLHSQRDPDQILGILPFKWCSATWTTVLNRCATVERAKRDGNPPRAEYLQSSKECSYCPFFHLCHGAAKARKRGQKIQHPQLGEVLHVKDLHFCGGIE